MDWAQHISAGLNPSSILGESTISTFADVKTRDLRTFLGWSEIDFWSGGSFGLQYSRYPSLRQPLPPQSSEERTRKCCLRQSSFRRHPWNLSWAPLTHRSSRPRSSRTEGHHPRGTNSPLCRVSAPHLHDSQSAGSRSATAFLRALAT